MSNIEKYSEKTFEDIKHLTDDGIEFWYARELQLVLGYKQWRRFSDTIERAKIACENSGNIVNDHFADVGKMVQAGVAIKDIGDIMQQALITTQAQKCHNNSSKWFRTKCTMPHMVIQRQKY